ncbi:LRR and NB-ARC domains-containing diseaseresistance protein, partial [Striga asiatica]
MKVAAAALLRTAMAIQPTTDGRETRPWLWLRDDWGCSYMPSTFAYLGRIYCLDLQAFSKRKRKISRRRWYGHIHCVKRDLRGGGVIGDGRCWPKFPSRSSSEKGHGTEASS